MAFKPSTIYCFERYCRLCAEEQDVTIMIFSQEAEDMLLQNKLNKYLHIQVKEDDTLPKNICINCCSKLQTVCEFIDCAQKAQEVLTNINTIIKPEIEVNSEQTQRTDIKEELNDETSLVNDNDDEDSKMEISVDPLMVLQNSAEAISDFDTDALTEDVTYMYGVDEENVSIRLIKKDDKVSELEEEKKPDILKPFPCVTCNRSFCTELALKNHSWTHVNGNVNSEKNSEEQFKCGTCFEVFDYKRDLVTHLKQHKTSGLCQLCGRMFRTEKTYAAHMSVHLTANKSYTCKICGRSYSNWSNLKTHNITHSSERPHQCVYCKKAFKRKIDLKFHINQHTGAKPYKCPFCDKCFASSGNCYSHRSRMHPGKRIESKARRWGLTPKDSNTPQAISSKTPVKGVNKYQCQICDHSFLKRDNFNYHMYQHTGVKPFQCTFCPERFFTRRVMLIHHDKKHPDLNRPLALLSKNVLLK
ncbi:hypothetical protein K1T71_001823 [Dendrolimus kikuchii]|uniref:Uncharacterized protein n=1 Tax=Dendrolimus kikuchii TaxID=765133 RepID=A0ACC1DFC1_9NEOP|nr:hypothetical protein K1T71_001823 [Dendrolimus kikuchii]